MHCRSRHTWRLLMFGVLALNATCCAAFRLEPDASSGRALFTTPPRPPQPAAVAPQPPVAPLRSRPRSQQLQEISPGEPASLARPSSEYNSTSAVDARRFRMYPVQPFVVDDAVITGVAGDGLQAWTDEGPGAVWAPSGDGPPGRSSRALLHGKRRAAKYSVCNQCTMISCNRNNFCTGHCKRRRRLFTCTRRGVVRAVCNDPDPPDAASRPIGVIEPLTSVIVTATAPFLGCATISDQPSGCPVPGTTAVVQNGRHATVRRSECKTNRYKPNCVREPQFPFGYCECLVDVAGALQDWSPCRTTEVDLSGSRGGSVSVEAGSETTRTGWFDYEEEVDEPWTRHSSLFQLPQGEVKVVLEIVEAIVMPAGWYGRREAVIPSDYDYGDSEPPL